MRREMKEMLIETGIIGLRGSGRIEFNPQKYLQEEIIRRHADIRHGVKTRRADALARQ